MRLEDGTGVNGDASVDYKQRLDTHSTTREEEELAILEGDGVQVNSGWISSLADGESALLYVKKVYRLPDGGTGTIIDDAVGISIKSNQNFGSNDPFDSLNVYEGSNGKTIVGAEHAIFALSNSSSQATRFAVSVKWVLPRGAAMAISIDPDISAGTVEAYVGFAGFFLPRDLT